MKKNKISANVIRRLPRYLRHLDDLAYKGHARVSSSELGKKMNLTASQIRQDFSCFGEFGQQGYGYNIALLRDEISDILGMKEGYTAVLVGLGNLGRAIVQNFQFGAAGVELQAAFDSDPSLIGKEFSGLPVYDSRELENYLGRMHPHIVILTLPRRHADEAAKIAVAAGVPGIWNFTNIELSVSHEHTVIENVHFSDSLQTLTYQLKNGDYRN